MADATLSLDATASADGAADTHLVIRSGARTGGVIMASVRGLCFLPTDSAHCFSEVLMWQEGSQESTEGMMRQNGGPFKFKAYVLSLPHGSPAVHPVLDVLGCCSWPRH